jgi:phosphatidylglycerol---prolipoprotein diacylglyceryl transferase
MPHPFVWNVDPVLVRLGPVSIRYYGVFFGLAIVTGFVVWSRRVRRCGESRSFAEAGLWWGVGAAVVGGRLGDCFLYHPRYYLAHPLQVVSVWQGGLSSHGAAAGFALATWAFARRHQVTWLRVSDYLVPAIALAGGWIRLGNFFNSEIVGRPAAVPWAVVFARYDAIPRHPAQLYDGAMALVTYAVLRAVERRSVRPIGSGLMSGIFLSVYFALRIGIEAYKDFYVEELRDTAAFRTGEQLLGAPIHTGQWLSVLPMIAGVALVARALRRPAASASVA